MPRNGASNHITKSLKRNTKHKPKDKKEEIEEETTICCNNQEKIYSRQNMPKFLELLTK